MLEHLERAYQVEPVVAEFLHRDIADLTGPAAPIRALRHRPGHPVRLHAQIPVALRQPGAERTLAAADLQHVADPGG